MSASACLRHTDRLYWLWQCHYLVRLIELSEVENWINSTTQFPLSLLLLGWRFGLVEHGKILFSVPIFSSSPGSGEAGTWQHPSSRFPHPQAFGVRVRKMKPLFTPWSTFKSVLSAAICPLSSSSCTGQKYCMALAKGKLQWGEHCSSFLGAHRMSLWPCTGKRWQQCARSHRPSGD